MKTYAGVHSQNRPQPIEITKTQVFVNKNINEYVRDGFTGYEYDIEIYDKDEYILVLATNQEDIAALREELEAAKILLGVE